MNQPKTNPVIGVDKPSKQLIKSILHSLNELETPIKVSSYSTLLAFGMEISGVNRTEAPNKESSLFVLHAAQDCAIRATDILSQEGIAPSNPYLSFNLSLMSTHSCIYMNFL